MHAFTESSLEPVRRAESMQFSSRCEGERQRFPKPWNHVVIMPQNSIHVLGTVCLFTSPSCQKRALMKTAFPESLLLLILYSRWIVLDYQISRFTRYSVFISSRRHCCSLHRDGTGWSPAGPLHTVYKLPGLSYF